MNLDLRTVLPLLLTALGGWSTLLAHIRQAQIDIARGADANGVRETALQAIFRDVPELVALLQAIFSLIFPSWGGTVVRVIVFFIDHSHPMDADEERVWMDWQNTET